jgi:polyisoprenoid-binding protein YceI
MGTWKFDPYHTQVEFSAKHFGMMTVRGNFHEVVAGGEIHPDQPERSKVEATIKTASIRTHNEQRDNDLRSSNFLEIDKYPTITFKSTRVQHVEGDHYKVTGDLTIKATTKPVTLDVVRFGELNDPTMMGHRISYQATTRINRKDFGMNFDAIRDGRLVVSNEIDITIEGEILEAAEQPAEKKEAVEAAKKN